MENRFNLIDEPWIPVADVGRVGLRQIFSNPEYRALGGNPVEKIALLKLLLAIGQAATELPDEQAWQALNEPAMADQCLAYLEKWHDRFYLYGERPFLQMPAIAVAKKQSNYTTALPWAITSNTTILTQFDIAKDYDDGEKALLIVVIMGFARSGKMIDNSVSLTNGYQGKTAAGKQAPAMASSGLLHSYVGCKTLLSTMRINLLTNKDLKKCAMYPSGIGTAPWETMPSGEDCDVARKLRKSLIGRLVPLCRFCLLREDGFHYSEGVAHMNYLDGIHDPTVAADSSKKKVRVLWADPEKRPWRQLPALLSFINQKKQGGFYCLQLALPMSRVVGRYQEFSIWSGGIQVKVTPGEQKVSGKNDFVESQVWVNRAFGDFWFEQLCLEMEGLEDISKQLYSCIYKYYTPVLGQKEKKKEKNRDNLVKEGQSIFWQLCERDFQALVYGCDQEAERKRLRQKFAAAALNTYDHFCPNDTSRQLDAWARCRPNCSKYLKKEHS